MKDKKVVLKVIEGGGKPAAVQDSLPFASDGGPGQTAASRAAAGAVWVDVEDGLPEEGETVLVCAEDYALGFGYRDEDEWQVSIAPWCCVHTPEPEVYYWMPIPPLP